jgi:hypothetical protein
VERIRLIEPVSWLLSGSGWRIFGGRNRRQFPRRELSGGENPNENGVFEVVSRPGIEPGSTVCNTLPPTLDEEVLQMALQGKILGNLITTNRNYEH